MRGTKLLHVCMRAGLDSITEQQGNITAELWRGDWNSTNIFFSYDNELQFLARATNKIANYI